MIPGDIQKKHKAARDLLLANNFAKALPLYEKLARQCPGAAAIWTEYGNAACRLRENDLADRAWHRALRLAPHNAELIALIGHQYQGSRQPEKARDCFAKAAAADALAV